MRGIFKFIKGSLVLLILGVMACGCSKESGDPSFTDNGWSTYYAKNAGSLPSCSGNIVGRLYYVEDQANFQVCKSTGWTVINIGNTASSMTICQKTSSGLAFEYTITNFTNGDKFVSCSVADINIGLSGSYYWKSNLPGATRESCLVTFDIDTGSAGYWIFEKVSGLRGAMYNDSSSSNDGSIVAFSSGECSTGQ